MKILVVDDVGYSRHFQTRMLQKAGHSSIGAGSGAEAIRILRTDHSVDVVLTDLMMPDIDGIDLCKVVKQMERMNDEGPVKPPIFILMTALHPGRNALPRDVERIALAKEVGFVEVLFKPIEIESLIPILKRIESGQASAPRLNLSAAIDRVRSEVESLLKSGDASDMDTYLDAVEMHLIRLRDASLEAASK